MSNKVKPVDSHWTDDQWKAISTYEQNLLIAAAAGSGKTAVLVERIIRRISAETDPIDVDRLLVATFTKAAADEMRQRIREALELKLTEQPDSQHIRRQLALIHRASITTLHSFCLDVVRRYFQMVQIDPGFRIGNETEMELMRHDALAEVFEHYYATSEDDSDFWRLIDAYSGERSDDALFQLVLQLYDFSRSHPWPEHWLTEMAAGFAEPDEEHNVWLQSLLHDAKLECAGALASLQEALQLARQPDGPDAYVDSLTEDLVAVNALYDAVGEDDWSAAYTAFQALNFPRLKAARGDHINKDIQEKVKQLRDDAKNQLLQLKEECFTRSSEAYKEEMQRVAPLMNMLVELVNAFAEQYRGMKAAKGLVDFNDLEHYCLHILRAPQSTPSDMIPSHAALDYQDQFVEVLLDEYQDTNQVQEAIVSLIAKPAPGNRFMVGDVKQSIYRFRLAEPALFLQKYRTYRDINDGDSDGESVVDRHSVELGSKIDLAQNFRSSRQVVAGVNYLFKQIMERSVGEIDYDEKAELVYGATYLEQADHPIEMLMIDRAASVYDDVDGDEDLPLAEGDLETVQMEARLIAAQIKKLMGNGAEEPFQVFDKERGGMRAVTFRDIVILLRATKQWAPVMIEEFKRAGIPSYAELNTGYFEAGEIEIVLSLLQVIDNPLQDIPLVAVLRSPLYQLTADELAQIRILSKGAPFYEAVLNYAEAAEVYNPTLQSKLKQFMQQWEGWREQARQGALSELISQIYRETGYYDLVGGLAGGMQRQANLRALYDRARQYEQTSFRGLFRFLRFIERMKDSGGDLGTARALGEQEDVVRIVSIHRSKGLEYPVVFVAGLGRMFNRQDLNGQFLIHKELGFGPKYVDEALRISYPTLPHIAIKRTMRLELLAEELRVLYVALTRAKEKLFLVSSLRDVQKELEQWAVACDVQGDILPEALLARATCYMDWIGPALMRHPDAAALRERLTIRASEHHLRTDASRWSIEVFAGDSFVQQRATREQRHDDMLEAIRLAEAVPVEPSSEHAELTRRLDWDYPYRQSETYFSKTSVSEMKRLASMEHVPLGEGQDEEAVHSLFELAPSASFQKPLLRRPRFLQEEGMSATERGTLYHAVMQYMPLHPNIERVDIEHAIANMVEKQFLTEEQSAYVQPEVLEQFFMSEIGQRLLRAERVYRELPFSYGLPIKDVYPNADEATADETVLIQGVIDCLFEDENGFILIDYKTDAVYGNQLATIRERYELQIKLYAQAIEAIWQRPVHEKVLFLFDGGHILNM